MSKVNYEDIANALIDDYCEVYGVNQAIEMLYTFGISREDLVNELMFTKENVTEVCDFIDKERGGQNENKFID